MNRYIVLDLYLYDTKGRFLACKNQEGNVVSDVITTPIMYLEQDKHPIEQIREYLKSRNLIEVKIELAPSLFLNKFDTEPDKDYLVLAFKVTVEDLEKINKSENDILTTFEEYKENPNLLPEFKKKFYIDSINGKQVFYRGYYKDSDGSYEVLNIKLLN